MPKAIPTILEIRDSTRMIDEVRGMRSDLTSDADWKRRMESDIKAIKAKIGIT